MNEFRSVSRLERRRSLTVAVALLLLLGTGFHGRCAAPFVDSVLATYELEVVPSDPSRFVAALQRPAEPFVMANLLAFKDMATGEGFEGLTGAEAYQIYVEGITELQQSIGSRLIWGGAVRDQIVGSSDPLFDTIALLEYASPSAFLGFALRIPTEADAGRSAGLFGQWLVASTTLEEPEPSSPEPSRGRGWRRVDRLCEALDPQRAQRQSRSGLTFEQVCRVLDGPDAEPVHVVELLRFADESGELYRPYREALASATESVRGELVWRGSLDAYALGIADPSFDELVVTRYPSPRAYLRALRHPSVRRASASRAGGLELHWIYTADDVSDQLDF